MNTTETRIPPEAQVVYVKQAGNGFAVAGLVLGLTGIVLGQIAIGFIFGWLFGILAVTFGLLGRRKAKREPAAGRKTMATWAVVLGILAFASGTWGYVTVNNAVNDFNKSMDQTQQQLDSYSQCVAQAQTLAEMDQC